MNTKKTSKKVVSLASKKLKDNSSSKTTKKQSGSSSVQIFKEKETSDKVTKKGFKNIKK